MGRRKSEFLSAFGIANQVFKALVDAVLRAGGDDSVLRKLEDPMVADEVAAVLMRHSESKLDLRGLPPVEYMKVGYRTERWSMIDPAKYYKCDEDVRPGRFWLRHDDGDQVVVGYTWFEPGYFDCANYQDLLKEVKRRGLELPDRAIAERVMDEYPPQVKTVAASNLVQLDSGRRQAVAAVEGFGCLRDLRLHPANHTWDRMTRFLVVVSEERIS